MAITARQLQDIMDEYDQLRRSHELLIIERRDQVADSIPEIASIDKEIAHISLEEARHLLYAQEPDADQASDLSGRRIHDRVQELSRKRVHLLIEHGYPPDYLDPIYLCEKCKDTGYIDNRRCTCLEEKIRRILAVHSGLDPENEKERFSSFRFSYYSNKVNRKAGISPRENIENIMAACREFVRNFDRQTGENLLITGNTGVGKTHLSRCLGNELLTEGKQVLYLTAFQLFKILEDQAFHRSNNSLVSEEDILQCELLIIDDLGTELTNAFINSRLFLCMNERILQKRSTVINTNLSLEQISSIYSERISSRIIESYTVLSIIGDDIRIKKALSSLDG